MVGLLKQIYRSTVGINYEVETIGKFLKCISAIQERPCKALEVGCGYGRHLRLLTELGFDATGVDTNYELVRANQEAGLRCLLVEEFRLTDDTYDVVLMSHVIEHFLPKDLLSFLDSYLDRLKVGGKLIIATPLLTPYFYDDFDHVKPYHPMGILMVFGADLAQVQYYSRNKLTLEDVWIRRSPLRLPHTIGRYKTSYEARPRQMLEFFSAVLFRISGGLIGESDGWVGLFRKVS